MVNCIYFFHKWLWICSNVVTKIKSFFVFELSKYQPIIRQILITTDWVPFLEKGCLPFFFIKVFLSKISVLVVLSFLFLVGMFSFQTYSVLYCVIELNWPMVYKYDYVFKMKICSIMSNQQISNTTNDIYRTWTVCPTNNYEAP